jgi:uncharacterized protein YjiS (DUF1127 family)
VPNAKDGTMTSLSTNSVPRASWGGNFLRKVAGFVTRGIHNMQEAQMTSVLSNMTDEQLKEIDVKRSEIAQHAEKLVN